MRIAASRSIPIISISAAKGRRLWGLTCFLVLFCHPPASAAAGPTVSGTPFVVPLLVFLGIMAIALLPLIFSRYQLLRQQNRRLQSEIEQLQRMLESEQQRLETLIETLPLPFYSKDAQQNYLRCNQSFCTFINVSRDQVIGHNVFDLLPAEQAEAHAAADRQLQPGTGTLSYQTGFYRPDGLREVLFSKSGLFDSEGKLLEILGVMTDVSELNNSRLFLDNILNTLSYPVFVKDERLRYRMVNRALCGFVDYSATEMLGKTDSDLYRKREAERFRTTDLLSLQQQEPISFESVITGKTGKSKRISVRKQMFRDHTGQKFLVGVYNDITGLYLTQEKMANLQNLVYSIIDSMPSLVIAINMFEQVTQWNKRAEELSGCATDVAVGQLLSDVFPFYKDLQPLISQAINTEQSQKKQKVRWKSNGEEHFVDLIVYPLNSGGLEGLVIRADNIDERVKMEEMMIFTEKMISVGSLAAGMAHEINNPLAVIIQNAQVLRSRFQPEILKNKQAAEDAGTGMEQIQRYLETRHIPETLDSILESGSRASRIVADMVNFSQRRVSCYTACDLRQLIRDTLELARNDYDLKKKYAFREIEIVLDLADNLPPLYCEMDQIQQVLLNLLRNGAQAMHDNPDNSRSPQFTIRAYSTEEKIIIEVSDNGPGIDPTIQQQIFEPFFSTRPVGTGTGLGLSTAYFIVSEKHGGNIRVDSTLGIGCRFVIELPQKGKIHGI